MAARTEKQRQQWKARTLQGDRVGLAAWIGSKMYEILKAEADDDLRAQMEYHSYQLRQALLKSATNHGWKKAE